MNDKNHPADVLKEAVKSTMRAISGDPELEVTYSADKPGMSGKQARLPTPTKAMRQEHVKQIRGLSDSMALRLKHHDAQLHMRGQPAAGVARDIYDALEQARVEAIGGNQMSGVAENLDSVVANRCKGDGLESAAARDDVPLASALALLAREHMTGRAVPENASGSVDMVRDWIDDRAGEGLSGLLEWCVRVPAVVRRGLGRGGGVASVAVPRE
ncbi:MAG: hypothetical protein AAF862_02695, partial [Pseudomonadota bacterium]